MTMMSTKDYTITEANGDQVNIPDASTPEVYTNLLMTGLNPSNAESSTEEANGPSTKC